MFDNEDVEEARHRFIDMLVTSERHGHHGTGLRISGMIGPKLPSGTYHAACLIPPSSAAKPSSQSVSDDEEDLESIEGISQPINKQFEVENSTYYSSRRR